MTACACRTRNALPGLRLFVLALAVLLAGWAGLAGQEQQQQEWRKPPPTEGIKLDVCGWTETDSDTPTVRRALGREAMLVAFGSSELTLTERMTLDVALQSRDTIGLTEPLRAELASLRGGLRMGLDRLIPGERDRILAQLTEERLLSALALASRTDAPCVVRVDEFAVEAGFARYQHWKVRVLLRSCEMPAGSGVTRWYFEEQRVRLPDTYQTYVRLVVPPHE